MSRRGSAAEGVFLEDIPEDTSLRRHLGELSAEVREALLRIGAIRRVAAGAVVMEDNSPCDELGYILEGTLAMVKHLRDGRRHIIGLLVPTDFFGRLFDGPATFSVEAIGEARLLSFPRAPFEALLGQEPDLERLFMVHLLDELDAAREWLLLMNGPKVVQRVASFLLILLRRMADNASSEVVLPLARKDLAHYLGARPETLSRAFASLARQGAIEPIDAVSGRYRVLDRQMLLDLSGQDLVLE
ncbi:CRP/FNR family transcriptional regulator, anaerobic regulatory protein [[Luteovulum] sphaeroides subsp. megalophilum]|uniref:Crp/Fnr family transcriptional regulator n=1 Tax=Cereibacter sphaeroides TaxID=1063 RepID=UPI000B7329E3|nr:Crp/Fnr family transcriptional regulator [Cereibacter sphaeroides]SNT43009.1 CRP/FNR family transcriptional regulator, anaerobic regulatory protein [[Luteovulum] sphaeroides subsp. megalophilum]